MLLSVSALVFLCGPLLVWRSRWNLPALTGIGFWAVAYLVPTFVLKVPEQFPAEIQDLYVKVMTVGALFYIVGLFLGSKAVHNRVPGAASASAVKVTSAWVAGDEVRVRTMWAVCIGILLLAGSLAVMGFIPMFASDPYAAKFFRGAYADAYRPVAVYFRLGTAILSTLLASLAAYVLVRKKAGGVVLLTVSVALMLMTLQRGSAGAGLLLLIGAYLAWKKHPVLVVLFSLLTYVGGALSWAALNLLGFGTAAGADTIWMTIGASVPDVSDHLQFLQKWLAADMPLTEGKTFWGGLIPGNFPWNPSVWSLTLGDDSIDVQTIQSGGLRLPIPIWGLVSFGWWGVVLVTMLSGIATGWLTRRISQKFPADSLIHGIWIIVLYDALVDVFGDFYILSYMSVVRLALVLFLIKGKPAARQEVGAANHRMNERRYS